MKFAVTRLRAATRPSFVVMWSLVALTSFAGCHKLFDLETVEPPPDSSPGENNGYVCTCTCDFGQGAADVPLSVCAPATLNPNRPNGVTPTPQQLADDCTDRVQVQVQRLSNRCYAPNPSCTCSAGAVPDTFYDASCDQGCAAVELVDCAAQWDPQNGITVANCGGPQLCESPGPVCLRQTTTSAALTPMPLSAGLMGRASQCTITDGTVEVGASDQSDTSPMVGTVNFSPAPPGSCSPGDACVVMDYRLDATETLHFDGFLGFGDTDIANVVTVGASAPFPVFSSGPTFVSADSTQTSGRALENGDHRAAFGTNNDRLVVGFAAGECSIQGDLLGGVGDPDGDNAGVSMDLRVFGVVANTPPDADFGGDRSVECTSPAGATVQLAAGASSDLEGNIVAFSWFLGTRDESNVLGTGASLNVGQALGAQTYVLAAIDAYMQAGDDSGTISVVDTTAPTVDCNAPATITPRRTPYVFTAAASDACDGALEAPVVLDYECFAFNKAGKQVARRCDVGVSGATLTLYDSGGIGDHVRWRVASADAHANGTVVTCETEVVRPGPGPT
jgi:hypothetical protein